MQCGFPSIEDCASRAQAAINPKEPFEALMFYMMSLTPEKGLEIGLAYVRGKENSLIAVRTIYFHKIFNVHITLYT